MNGIYVMYFTGATGSGHGLLLLQNGTITGADAAGVTYDGTYRLEGDNLVGTLKMIVPAGTSLVTGAAAGSSPLTFDIPLTLPSNFADGMPRILSMPTGPVNIIFRRLRDLT